MKEQTKYPITKDSCPWCGAEYQLGPGRNGEIYFDEDIAAVEPVKCRTCGAKWVREYSIKYS